MRYISFVALHFPLMKVLHSYYECNCLFISLYSLQHQYINNGDQVTGSNSLSRAQFIQCHIENSHQSPEKNKFLSNQVEGIVQKQDNNVSVPTAQTIILREWII